MPRKPRIVFDGACYHIINRGNFRFDIFAARGAAAAFERCLFETAKRFGWVLHAFVIMRNHFHLALETPGGNLVEGMHWLETTFATRFNLHRDERGHVFQGRYKAILVEPGARLASLVNYIHLNPVKAGIVTVDNLADYRWSSFRRFVKGPRPPFLVCADWLREVGDLQDSPAGWRSYRDYLRALAADSEVQKREAFERMCEGWALGSECWRKEVAAEQAERLSALRLRGEGVQELKEAVWARALDALLHQAGKSRADASAEACGAAWKIAAAVALRRSTTATNAWIARELSMGAKSSVSVYISKQRAKSRI